MKTRLSDGLIRPGEVPLLIMIAICAVIMLLMCGCATFPTIEACYVHPKYGKICAVRTEGKWYIRVDIAEGLDPEAKIELVNWIKEQEK